MHGAFSYPLTDVLCIASPPGGGRSGGGGGGGLAVQGWLQLPLPVSLPRARLAFPLHS